MPPPPAAPVLAAPPRPLVEAPESPRKLIRPRLPADAQALPLAPRRLRGPAPFSGSQARSTHALVPDGHAEALYFRKQIETQTPMVFVLDDGEQIRGIVEWHDRDSIKVRGTTRTLIYKQAIKYLHKAAEL